MVSFLRRMPSKRRVSLYTRVYLAALKGYPYRFEHMVFLQWFVILTVIMIIFYISITYSSFYALNNPDTVGDAYLRNVIVETKTAISSSSFFPWVALFLTIMLSASSVHFIFYQLPKELLVPFAFREMSRLKECVQKCGSNTQFLRYIDAEHTARDLEDLKNLVAMAKEIMNGVDLKLSDEIISGLSEDFPEIT